LLLRCLVFSCRAACVLLRPGACWRLRGTWPLSSPRETCSPLFICPGPPVHAVGRVAPTAHACGAGMVERPRSQGAHGSVDLLVVLVATWFAIRWSICRTCSAHWQAVDGILTTNSRRPVRATWQVCPMAGSDLKSLQIGGLEPRFCGRAPRLIEW